MDRPQPTQMFAQANPLKQKSNRARENKQTEKQTNVYHKHEGSHLGEFVVVIASMMVECVIR
jgi:hypothetical protein